MADLRVGSFVAATWRSSTEPSSFQAFSRSYSFSSSPSASRFSGSSPRTFVHRSIETLAFFIFSEASFASSIRRVLRSSMSASLSLSISRWLTAISFSQSRRFSYICLTKESASAFSGSSSRIVS